MIFTPTTLPGAYIIDLNRLQDERGFFARSWCQREFSEHRLDPCLVQCNISFNPYCGTLRGIHFQTPPYAETKLVRCTRGALYDVVVDLRLASPAYLRWFAIKLDAENRSGVYIPKGCGHAFLTLEDDTEIFYQMSEFYSPAASQGVRWNDPAFRITWPQEVRVISDRDSQYPDYCPQTPFFVE